MASAPKIDSGSAGSSPAATSTCVLYSGSKSPAGRISSGTARPAGAQGAVGGHVPQHKELLEGHILLSEGPVEALTRTQRSSCTTKRGITKLAGSRGCTQQPTKSTSLKASTFMSACRLLASG